MIYLLQLVEENCISATGTKPGESLQLVQLEESLQLIQKSLQRVQIKGDLQLVQRG